MPRFNTYVCGGAMHVYEDDFYDQSKRTLEFIFCVNHKQLVDISFLQNTILICLKKSQQGLRHETSAKNSFGNRLGFSRSC